MTLAPCIYCRSDTTHRTKEHVLQAGFGGAVTLPYEVCADCNAAFSAPDKALMHHVDLFGGRRLRGLGGLGFLEDADAGVSVTVFVRLDDERNIVRLPPQVYRHPDGTWRFIGADEAGLAGLLRDVVQPAVSVDVRAETDADDSLPIPLTIVRTAPNTFVVRGTDAEEIASIAAQLRTSGMRLDYQGEPTASASYQPKIRANSSFPVGEVSRALAKLALNYLCLLFGPETALREEFDPVRRLARFNEGAFGELVVLSMMNGGRDVPNPYADLNRHVRFPQTPSPMLPLGTWRVSYFDHVRKAVEHLAVPRDGLRRFANMKAILPGLDAQVESP